MLSASSSLTLVSVSMGTTELSASIGYCLIIVLNGDLEEASETSDFKKESSILLLIEGVDLMEIWSGSEAMSSPGPRLLFLI